MLSFREKKAQSALEYLMTYGWGIVVIGVVIATLILITNPNAGSATASGFQTNFSLVNTANPSDSAGQLELLFTNNSGRDLTLSDVTVKQGNTTIGGSPSVEGGSFPFLFRAGTQRKIFFTPNPSWPSGNNQFQVELVATDQDGFQKNSSGSVSFSIAESGTTTPACHYSAPSSGYFTTLTNVPVTISYSNFSNQPENPTVTVNGTDLVLSCSGNQNGNCSSTGGFTIDKTSIPIPSVTLTASEGQSAVCTGFSLAAQFCGDGTCNGSETFSSCPQDNCATTSASCTFTAPADPLYNSPPTHGFAVTVDYADFSSTPTGSVTCPDGNPVSLNCSGSAVGNCNATCSNSPGPAYQVSAVLSDSAHPSVSCTPNPYSFAMQYCGDSTKNGTEECDGGTAGNNCTTIGQGFTGGTLNCYAPGTSQPCQWDTSQCITGPPTQNLSSCGVPTNGWQDNYTYKLTQNVQAADGAAGCFDITGSGPNGVTLDCQGKTISTLGFLADSLVKISRNKVTLKNCNLTVDDYLGVYSALEINGDDANIQGPGSGTAIFTSNSDVPTLLVAAKNARIEAPAPSNFLIKNTSADSFGQPLLIDGNNATVKSVTVQGENSGGTLYGSAIQIGGTHGGSNATIQGSIIRGNWGVFVTNAYGSVLAALITGNTIEVGGASPQGIMMDANSALVTSNAQINTNTITVLSGSTGAPIGINILAPGFAISNNQISVNNGTLVLSGISVGSAFRTINLGSGNIVGNTITVTAPNLPNAKAIGVQLRNTSFIFVNSNPSITVVSNNSSAAQSASYGVLLTADFGYSLNNQITGNTISLTHTANPDSKAIYVYSAWNGATITNFVQGSNINANNVCGSSTVASNKSIDVNASNAQSSASGFNTCAAANCYQYYAYSTERVCQGAAGWSNCRATCP